MSYSLDVNILIYASDVQSLYQSQALQFLHEKKEDPDLLCMTWLALMSYQRITTHAGIFKNPLTPEVAWRNIKALLAWPRVRLIGETPDFSKDYHDVTSAFPVRGNLVSDAHLATILRQHGVRFMYSTDSDFRKFDFLKVINPFR